MSRATALGYRLMDRARHPRAIQAAGEPATARGFESLHGARHCLVITSKRSGEPVPTPVNFGLSHDGSLCFRSEPDAAKIRRLRRDPIVRVCRCSLRGKPLGPLVEASARVLDESENARSDAILAANYRADMRLLERGLDRVGIPVVYVELTPSTRGVSRRPRS